MRKLTLLTSVLLASSFQTVNVSAQCMNTINCQALGYTKTSCTKGGVKCPTGNYWYCPKDTTTPQCDSSYKYTCTGAYQSPSGTACNGLYTSCTCTSGYQWTNGSCQKKEIAWGTCTGLVQNCAIGTILYSDGTCMSGTVNGKTPIGIVVYTDSYCGYALALEDAAVSAPWSTERIDVPYNPEGSSDVSKNCAYTRLLIDLGAEKYPAAQAAYRYIPQGAEETQGKWCLPSYALFNAMRQHLSNINQGLNDGGFSRLPTNLDYWSSTEYSAYSAYSFKGSYSKSTTKPVRAVIQF